MQPPLTFLFADYRDYFDVVHSRQWWVSRSRPGDIQLLRLTPRISSFLANESLRFAAFAAVSVAAWMALGPLFAAALISPNLWAAFASARLNVAMSSACAMGGFTVSPISINAVTPKFGRWCEARLFSSHAWPVSIDPPFERPSRAKSPA